MVKNKTNKKNTEVIWLLLDSLKGKGQGIVITPVPAGHMIGKLNNLPDDFV